MVICFCNLQAWTKIVYYLSSCLQVTITLSLPKLCEINNNKYKLGTVEHNIPDVYCILNFNTWCAQNYSLNLQLTDNGTLLM